MASVFPNKAIMVLGPHSHPTVLGDRQRSVPTTGNRIALWYQGGHYEMISSEIPGWIWGLLWEEGALHADPVDPPPEAPMEPPLDEPHMTTICCWARRCREEVRVRSRPALGRAAACVQSTYKQPWLARTAVVRPWGPHQPLLLGPFSSARRRWCALRVREGRHPELLLRARASRRSRGALLPSRSRRCFVATRTCCPGTSTPSWRTRARRDVRGPDGLELG